MPAQLRVRSDSSRHKDHTSKTNANANHRHNC